MFEIQCKACARVMDIPAREGAFSCPHCQNVYQIFIEGQKWKMENMGPPGYPTNAPLVEFELQIAPNEFLLMAVPGQPVLFDDSTVDGQNPVQVTLDKDAPNRRKFLTNLTNACKLAFTDVFSEPQHTPEQCFTPSYLDQPSFHLRLVWGNGHRWATMYPRDQIPSELLHFFEVCRQMAYDILENVPSQPTPNQEVLYILEKSEQSAKTDSYVKRAESIGAVAKVKVAWDSTIFVNGKKMRLRGLKNELQRIQAKQGLVKYFREYPERNDLPPKTEKVAISVLQMVMESGIPIQLSETDFS